MMEVMVPIGSNGNAGSTGKAGNNGYNTTGDYRAVKVITYMYRSDFEGTYFSWKIWYINKNYEVYFNMKYAFFHEKLHLRPK